MENSNMAQLLSTTNLKYVISYKIKFTTTVEFHLSLVFLSEEVAEHHSVAFSSNHRSIA